MIIYHFMDHTFQKAFWSKTIDMYDLSIDLIWYLTNTATHK